MVYPETFQAVGVLDFDDYHNPKRFEYKPQAFRDYDVDIKIEACGVCYSDVHAASGNWGRLYTPIAVGHEIIGRIVKIGPNAKPGLKLGDRVGVDAQCDCDSTCSACQEHTEQYCENSVATYLATYKESGLNTIGGNASHIRINSKLAFKIPDDLETVYAAPLLCGGITGFSPLLKNNVKKGTKVGVVGIGGIGHMTILFAKALGAEVTAISRGKAKEADARKLGADHYIATSEPGSLEKSARTLDLIVSTSSSFSQTSLTPVIKLLKASGTFSFITAPPEKERMELIPIELISSGYAVQGSMIGSPENIEYMLDFASKHKIKPWIETVEMNEENLGKIWKRMEDGDVRYRFTMVGYDKFFKDA